MIKAVLRLPLIVWGSGHIPETLWGRRNTTSVFSVVDLVPSLLDSANVPPSGIDVWDDHESAESVRKVGMAMGSEGEGK